MEENISAWEVFAAENRSLTNDGKASSRPSIMSYLWNIFDVLFQLRGHKRSEEVLGVQPGEAKTVISAAT